MADIADVEFVNVGSWGNGAGVFAQVSLGEMGEIGAGGDRVGKYLPEKELAEAYTINGVRVTKEEFFRRAKLAGLLPNNPESAAWVKSITHQPKDGSWISYQTEEELFVVSRIGVHPVSGVECKVENK